MHAAGSRTGASARLSPLEPSDFIARPQSGHGTVGLGVSLLEFGLRMK